MVRPHVNKKHVIEALRKKMVAMLQLLERFAMDASGKALGPHAPDAFECLRNFLPAGITLGALHTHRRGLLGMILAALGSTDDRTFEAAINVSPVPPCVG